jgi:hypothetical protein
VGKVCNVKGNAVPGGDDAEKTARPFRVRAICFNAASYIAELSDQCAFVFLRMHQLSQQLISCQPIN